ncbi:MAG: carbohydrate kinase family protein [Rhodobacteraceae bacterium]|nr:carbohydrate kinase family protein [Paracoccaceae bacterium]
MSAKVLCVGRIYCDLVFSGIVDLPRAGQETYAKDLTLFAGGGAYITGAYLAAAGLETSLCGIIPNGLFGAAIEDELAGSGLNLRACQNAGAHVQPQVTVVMSSEFDRAFLTRRTGAALPDTFSQTIATGGFTHLHIAELATLQEHPELITLAKQNGLSISLDCAWDEAAMTAPNGMDLLKNVDLFLPNEPELLKISPSDDGVDGAAKKLAESGPIVVVKRGAAGAGYWGPNGNYSAAPLKTAKAIDPTGAGDAFNAGFLARWLTDASPEDCLKNGNAFGMAAIGQLGGATAARSLKSQTVAV